MGRKLSRSRAEISRVLYVAIWTVLIAVSLLSSFGGESTGVGYFENKFLLPLLLAVILFLTELCYTFLDEKLRNSYKHVFGVIVCITLFFGCMFVLILFSKYPIVEYSFITFIFIVLGFIKWLKTPLLPHMKNGTRRVHVTRAATENAQKENN